MPRGARGRGHRRRRLLRWLLLPHGLPVLLFVTRPRRLLRWLRRVLLGPSRRVVPYFHFHLLLITFLLRILASRLVFGLCLLRMLPVRPVLALFFSDSSPFVIVSVIFDEIGYF